MDARGNIYRAPEDQIPAEDKARLDGFLIAREEMAVLKEAVLKDVQSAEFEARIAELEAERERLRSEDVTNGPCLCADPREPDCACPVHRFHLRSDPPVLHSEWCVDPADHRAVTMERDILCDLWCTARAELDSLRAEGERLTAERWGGRMTDGNGAR